MNLRRTAVAAACAAMAIGAAGCGGDDDSTSGGDTTAVETTATDSDTTATDTTTADITKEEWIEQADAICKAGDDEIEAAGAELDANSSEEDVQALITDVVVPNIADQADQISALPVPAGEEDSIGELTDALNQAVSDAEADPGALLTDDSTFEEVNTLAQDYGLTSCGNG